MSAMQQTNLDRWLRKKYVYTTHVYCNTLPRALPDDVVVDETTEEAGGMYLYRLLVPNDAALNELTARLEVENITYTSRVADETAASGKFFNNPNKSFTMQLAWLIFVLIIVGIIASGIPTRLWLKYTADVDEIGKKKAAIETIDTSRFFA